MTRFCDLLYRRKSLEYSLHATSKLNKCLTAVDLIFLGVGCTLGSGVFVLIGQVAHSMAGPSVLLCLFVAGVASIFAGMCYAEFGGRVPKAGSAYIYSYVTVGELGAFVIGWNLILEYVIYSASVARATSSYINTLSQNAISEYLTQHTPIHIASLSPYPDFIAFALILIFTGILCIGMRESSIMNKIFTVVNITIVIYAVICGLFWVDWKNWTIPADEVPKPSSTYGVGGFFPFGYLGTMSGAATCFYAYVGFDVIATVGEESINPTKSVPTAILGCLCICSISYIVPAIVLTLMVPYYDLSPDAALPLAFNYVGWPIAGFIIAVGAIFSLTASLLVSGCAMPRLFYAMASDGLLFSFLSKINERFQTPINATIVSGLLTAILAMLIELKDLIEMLSIGTLLAYTHVAACVILLRYEFSETSRSLTKTTTVTTINWQEIFIEVFRPAETIPSARTYNTVIICVALLAIFTVWSGLVLLFLLAWITSSSWWAIVLLVVPLLGVISVVFIIWRQPMNSRIVTFQVPFVPFVPAVSIFLNIYLMINLHPLTWMRFVVWMTAGFLIYFLYGIHHNEQHICSEDLSLKAYSSNYNSTGTSSDLTNATDDLCSSAKATGDMMKNDGNSKTKDDRNIVKSD